MIPRATHRKRLAHAWGGYPAFAVLLILFTSPACNRANVNGDKRSGRPPPTVVTAPVLVRDVPVEVEAPVDLKPIEQVEVGSKVLGYLDAVLVDRGDHVKRGQPVALVRPSDLPGQVAAARGSIAQIEANAALAKMNYARAQKLKPAGVMSDQELEQSAAAVASTEAAEAAARAQLQALAARLGETQITSPIDGFVANRRLDPGALVGPTSTGGAIATIMRVDRLRAFVNVNERFAMSIRVGMPARIELDAAEGFEIKGEVVRLSPAIDPNTRTMEAEVQVANPDGRLRPGLYGRAFIEIARRKGATVVPVSAVQINARGQSVFVVEGDQVAQRAVTIGTEVDRGRALEVTSGLNTSDQVVIAGADGLSNG
ncbi:MAG TPA: efflux RND transporter periplasmic adaptor subunit, partial [Polyangiaceae bacterium]|nr:efflux RND transporter periplasmic adaptor subunit [Polyangiaceae bacterium]